METTDYGQASDEALLEDYIESLEEYRHWVSQKYELNYDWDDEVFYLMNTRDDLHEMVVELTKRGLESSVGSLRKLDQVWQKWLLEHTDSNFDFKLRRGDRPKAQWWWWVDQLETLTDEQRSTL